MALLCDTYRLNLSILWSVTSVFNSGTKFASNTHDPDANKVNKKLSCRRDCAMLRVIKYFTKSLKVIEGHFKRHLWVGRVLVFYWNCLHLVPFLSYSAANNDITLKSGFKVFQGRWKWCNSIYHIWLSIGRRLYSSISYHFRVIWR